MQYLMVKFNPQSQNYTYINGLEQVKIGDLVVCPVSTGYGFTIGKVVNIADSTTLNFPLKTITQKLDT